MNRLRTLATVLVTALLPMMSQAASADVTSYSGTEIRNLIATGSEQSVPKGKVYQATLLSGESILLKEGTRFSLGSSQGKGRINLSTGTVLINQPAPNSNRLEIVVEDSVIQISNGAELLVQKDSDGIRLNQLNGKGTVKVNGKLIPRDQSGIVSKSGTFVSDASSGKDLEKAGQLLLEMRDPVKDNNLEVAPDVSQEGAPPEEMPLEIVVQDNHDVSAS